MSDVIAARAALDRKHRESLTDAEMEQEFRDYPILPNERFLLRLLDAERARAEAAEAKVADLTDAISRSYFDGYDDAAKAASDR